MMAQFHAAKNAHPDCILLFRMGDFYELFFDDAERAAPILDIALTHRGKSAEGTSVPMCGVPYENFLSYAAKLVQAGYKVALCDQVETPEEAKKRDGSKALVRREVVQVLTQGTLTEDGLVAARQNQYLAALARLGAREWGLAWCDLTTGDIFSESLGSDSVASALARVGPQEILVPETLEAEDIISGRMTSSLTRLPQAQFHTVTARQRLQDAYQVRTLEPFGDFSRAEISAAGALIHYVALTQKGRLPHFKPLKSWKPGTSMEMDPATRRHLELTENLRGQVKNSLLAVMDETCSAGGSRLLSARLSAPSAQVEEIRTRLDGVEFFVSETLRRGQMREILKAVPDLARSCGRASMGRAGPRDLAAVRDAVLAAEKIYEILSDAQLPASLESARRNCVPQGTLADLGDRLIRALVDNPPLHARVGGVIHPDYMPRLKELQTLHAESSRLVAALESEYKSLTGAANLKIRHNNVIGFFVEVPAKQAELLADREIREGEDRFIHRQSMANAVRFTTERLAGLERDISQARERAIALEQEIINQFESDIAAHSNGLSLMADAVAEIDVAAGLAELASRRRYVRPVVDDSLDFEVTEGRHPVVEAVLEKDGQQSFAPNDCVLYGNPEAGLSAEEDPDRKLRARMWLLTGPNMAGKSTFLRQNALIAVMAQAGSFVPASRARIGVVDRLFARVGAADNLAEGQSTFMVEMIETATILNQATERSLVIMDEIGRGTATYDGVAIAWACAEYLHNIRRSRALFATHYHELTRLGATLNGLACYTMAVREHDKAIYFLHRVEPGAADRSYGIHVAKLAGLPQPTLKRAEKVLQTLEKSESGDLPLFQAAESTDEGESVRESEVRMDVLRQELDALDPDSLSPRAALDAIYQLKALIKDPGEQA